MYILELCSDVEYVNKFFHAVSINILDILHVLKVGILHMHMYIGTYLGMYRFRP
jgi:hypothetical protein